MQTNSTPARLARSSAVLLAALAGVSAHASTLYWNGTYTAGSPATYGSWLSAGNWTTDAAGLTASTAAPTSSDDLVFNADPANSSVNQVAIPSDVFARSLTFSTSSSMRLSQPNTTAKLTLGGGGITVGASATGITIGESTGSLYTEVTANQAWVNNSTAGLSVRRLRPSNNAAGDVTVTLSANSTGATAFNNSISDSADGTKKLALVIDSSGTGTVSLLAAGTPTAGGTWTGGTLIKRGTLLSGNTTVGTGNIQLGDTTGNANATLRINTASAFTTNLAVQAGNTGVNTLEFVATNSATYAGTIALTGDLTVGVRNVTGGSFINGVVSGPGDLIKGQYQGTNTTGMLTLGGVNTYSGDTVVNVGAFTLADNAALTFYIGANGVNNKVRGAGTNAATFNGDFIFDFSGASLLNGNQWQIVDAGSLNESFSATFLVQGFSDPDNDNLWTNGAGFSFSEITGVLSYTAAPIPEPSSFAIIGGFAALAGAALRRRRRS